MKRRSAKAKEMHSRMRLPRALFISECSVCSVCNMAGSQDVHEILAGSHRTVAYQNRCCWLAVCRQCHNSIQSCVSIATQLAWKLLSDPMYYNRSEVCLIWGRADSAVTSDEVIAEVQKILIERNATY